MTTLREKAASLKKYKTFFFECVILLFFQRNLHLEVYFKGKFPQRSVMLLYSEDIGNEWVSEPEMEMTLKKLNRDWSENTAFSEMLFQSLVYFPNLSDRGNLVFGESGDGMGGVGMGKLCVLSTQNTKGKGRDIFLFLHLDYMKASFT